MPVNNNKPAGSSWMNQVRSAWNAVKTDTQSAAQYAQQQFQNVGGYAADRFDSAVQASRPLVDLGSGLATSAKTGIKAVEDGASSALDAIDKGTKKVFGWLDGALFTDPEFQKPCESKPATLSEAPFSDDEFKDTEEKANGNAGDTCPVDVSTNVNDDARKDMEYT